MRPLGQTRPLLAYGVPVAAGLVAGGALAAQGEDPGSAVLGGLTAGLGARAGLGAARTLAGKYSNVLPELISKGLEKEAGKSGRSVRQRLEQQIVNSPEYMSRGQAQTLYSPKTVGNIARTAALGLPASLEAGTKPVFAAGLVPASMALAGLGGVAAGAGLGALGVPGFQQGMAVDPEGYGSNNTPSAQFGVKSLASTQYV
jgi:hypothetical protein